MIGPGGIGTVTRIGSSNFRLTGTGTTPASTIQTLIHDFEFWRKISIFGLFFSNFCIKIITWTGTDSESVHPIGTGTLIGPQKLHRYRYRSGAPIPKLIGAPIVSVPVPVHRPHL